jgi:hypothetical protein
VNFWSALTVDLAFWLLFIGLVTFMFLICSLRINMVFFGIFFFLDVGLCLLTAAYWKAAEGNAVAFENLSKVICPTLKMLYVSADNLGPGYWRLCFRILHARLLPAVCTASGIRAVSSAPPGW